MQDIFGLSVLVMVFILSLYLGRTWVVRNSVNENNPIGGLVAIIISSLIFFICIYAVIFFVVGILWIVAEFGILLREIQQWLYEAIIHPFITLF